MGCDLFGMIKNLLFPPVETSIPLIYKMNELEEDSIYYEEIKDDEV